MIKEFVCPNGRMSVNGVCPIFEGDDGQIKDFNKTTKTFDEKYESIEDIEKDKNKSFFEFDFTKPTESAFESAGNIINNNLNAYDSFIEEKLGISSKAQTALRFGASVLTGSLMPFAIPFLGGMALRNSENKRIQNITNQDTQGTVSTIDPASVQTRMQIMSIQPTAQDIYRGGGSDRDTSPSRPTAQAGGFASDGGPVSNRTGKGRVGF